MSDLTREFGRQAMDALEKAVLSAFADANGAKLRISEVSDAIGIHEHNRWITDSTLRRLEADEIVKQLGKRQPFELTDEGRRRCRQLFGEDSV